MNTSKSLNLKISKQALVATMLITTLSSAPILASESINDAEIVATEKKQSKATNKHIGFGSGFVIGSIAAGPLGAIVAGVGGIFIAKYINVNNENEALNVALVEEKKASQLSFTQVKKQYQAKLESVEESYQQQLAALDNQQGAGQLQAENLLMSLQFSTGSSDIAAHYQEQVSALARILNSSPNTKIDLSGYTDLSGEEPLNQRLSESRVESVKTLLMAQGVDEKQIATFAFGEGAPVVANSEREVSFYDRRVVLKLHKPANLETQQVANNN